MHTFHKRGNIADKDLVTFAVIINQNKRGYGSATFPVVISNHTDSVFDRTEDGLVSYLAINRINMTEFWQAGPFEVAPDDDVTVAYTGFNVSDQSNANITKLEKAEIDFLNQVAKKGVALFLGAGLGEEIGGLFTDAFNELFENPVGDFIGYKPTGGCNGPVFIDAKRFSGRELDNLRVTPLTFVDGPGTRDARTLNYAYPGIRFTQHNTDEATHDSNQCGHIAETDVTFAIFRAPHVSVRGLMGTRFPTLFPSLGIRQLAPPGSAFSLKSVLGVLP
jgi:hypothetical protein